MDKLVLSWNSAVLLQYADICVHYTVPFRMIRQSRVTVPCGPALILVHVTRHFDFGRMRKLVQKKKHVQVPYQRYHSHY